MVRIANGESGNKVRRDILGLIKFHLPDVDENTLTWREATDILNSFGANLGYNQPGGVARSEINQLFDNTSIPEKADIYLDFLNQRYFNGSVTDTHPTDILALGSDGYETFGPNVLPRTDLGLLTTVGRTNKCENFNANPTDLTGMRTHGPGVSLEIVDDSEELAASGLSAVCVSGNVYKATIDSDYYGAVIISGTTGNTNPHTLSVFLRGVGAVRVRLMDDIGAPGYSSLTPSYERREHTLTPVDGGQEMIIQAGGSGATVYFILNQLEEGPFATDPIITSGSAAVRGGNRPVIDLTGRLDEGVAGVIKLNSLPPAPETDYKHILNFNDGSSNNSIIVQRNNSGGVRLNVISAGVADTTVAEGWQTGVQTFAFAVGNGFSKIRQAGGTDLASRSPSMPSGLYRAGIGSNGYSAENNTYQRTERLALKFGPQDQASFDAMYDLAQEWAS